MVIDGIRENERKRRTRMYVTKDRESVKQKKRRGKVESGMQKKKERA